MPIQKNNEMPREMDLPVNNDQEEDQQVELFLLYIKLETLEEVLGFT
jgi:hypothetical protein